MSSTSGTVMLHSQGKLDTFLSTAIPTLQGYVELIADITNKTLIIQQVVQLRVIPATILEYVLNIMKGQFQHIPVQPYLKPIRYNFKTQKEALTLCECIAVFNRKLVDVVRKEMKLEKTLSDKTSNLSRKIKKLTTLHTSVNEFTVLIDRILVYYTNKPIGIQISGLPTAEELKDAKRKLIILKKSLKHEELYALFSRYDSDFVTNQTNILLATVGITDESYGTFLFNMDEMMKMHQTELYYLEKMIKERACELEATEESMLEQGKEALKLNLLKLGFSAESSKMIVNNIPEELVDLQSPLFWALRYLRHAFQHHPLLTEQLRYIYQTEVTDAWFDQEIKREQDSLSEEVDKENDTLARSLKMINIATKSGSEKVTEFLNEQDNTEDVHLFYHGTTHNSAKSIVEDGITLSKGQDCQDFSSGDGFYVSEKFENAKSWSRAPQGQHQAVIVYRIKKQQLDASNGLDLMSSKPSWEEVITLCRNGYKNKGLKRKVFKDVDYVRGPMCRNPKDVVQRKKTPSGFGRDDDTQVCIRGEDFSEQFGSLDNIACVIFY